MDSVRRVVRHLLRDAGRAGPDDHRAGGLHRGLRIRPRRSRLRPASLPAVQRRPLQARGEPGFAIGRAGFSPAAWTLRSWPQGRRSPKPWRPPRSSGAAASRPVASTCTHQTAGLRGADRGSSGRQLLVTVEEHSTIGGRGSPVAEQLAADPAASSCCASSSRTPSPGPAPTSTSSYECGLTAAAIAERTRIQFLGPVQRWDSSVGPGPEQVRAHAPEQRVT